MFFNYPYTDMYNLNLDWMIKTVKECQNVIENLASVVNTFNGRSGEVTLEIEDVTALRIHDVNFIENPNVDPLTWPASYIEEYIQEGCRILLQKDTSGNYSTAYFIDVTDQLIPRIVKYDRGSGVSRINGLSGDVVLSGTDIMLSDTSSVAVTSAIDTLQNAVTELKQQIKVFVKIVAPDYSSHVSRTDADRYFIYQNQLRKALVPIAENAAITDTNSEVISTGGLNDLLDVLEDRIGPVENMIFPEDVDTNDVLSINEDGEPEWTKLTGAWIPENATSGAVSVADALENKVSITQNNVHYLVFRNTTIETDETTQFAGIFTYFDNLAHPSNTYVVLRGIINYNNSTWTISGYEATNNRYYKLRLQKLGDNNRPVYMLQKNDTSKLISTVSNDSVLAIEEPAEANTASIDIPANKYFVKNGSLFYSTTDIQQGDTLGNNNRRSVTNGGLNDIIQFRRTNFTSFPPEEPYFMTASTETTFSDIKADVLDFCIVNFFSDNQNIEFCTFLRSDYTTLSTIRTDGTFFIASIKRDSATGGITIYNRNNYRIRLYNFIKFKNV